MNKSVRILMSLLPALSLACIIAAPAAAQGKAKATPPKFERKVLLEDHRVVAYEVRIKPGGEGPVAARPFRVERVMKGGTIQRIYSDGKTETEQFKVGEVRTTGPDPAFKPRNVGKTEVVLYIVQPK